MSQSDSVRVAVLQAALADDLETNVSRVADLVRRAAAAGARIILPPELFEGPYFCREEHERFFAWARPAAGHPTLARFQELARALKVVIPVSFFERDGTAYYNSLALVDADGACLGIYRKSHIPAGPGYQEKFYFRPGDTGFRVWRTAHGCLGAGICWDQWFPECARALTLMGADLLLYPTAIGSEPANPGLDTREPWQRAMIGHAVCNAVPVAAANRVGREGELTFYGHSFVADHLGNLLAELDDREEGFAVAGVDLAAARRHRAAFGLFRDRRPDLYGALGD